MPLSARVILVSVRNSSEPLVSIVTPSLNMGRYLEETICSVLEQDYPRIEYLVVDGGSTDDTAAILDRYHDRIRCFVGRDGGQADAVNRGFGSTTGEIFTFLNADDTLLPGAVSTVVRAFVGRPAAGVVYGDAWHVAEDGARISPYPVEQFDAANLARRCFICQPAAFLRREAFAGSGMLDPAMRFALDYDLWIRVARRYEFIKVDSYLATSRLHPNNKTIGQMASALEETIGMLKRHYGYVPYNWLYGYGYHHLTGASIALEKPKPALASAFYSMAIGARYNWRHPLRYCRDILSTAWEAAR